MRDWFGGMCGVAALLGVAALPAMAQDTPRGAPATAGTRAPDAASGLDNTLVAPGNGGVAGTGLGKMTAEQKDGTGTGMSVKGPPGVGIDLGRGSNHP